MGDPLGLGRRMDAVAVHDAQAPKFGRWYDTFARNPYSGTFVYGRMKLETLIEQTAAPLPEGTRALDVGCGTGFNVSSMRARGFEVVGIEPAEAMRERAVASNPGVEIIDGDITKLPFEDSSFDLVLSVEVLRYLAVPALGIREIARVLRPGGVAILTAAPRWSLTPYALVNMVTSRISIPTFTKLKQSFLTAQGGTGLLTAAGFSHTEVHGLFFGPWILLGRVSPRLLERGLRAWEPLDDRLSGQGPLRDLANHLVLIGRK